MAASVKFICKHCQAPPATGVAGKLHMGVGSEIEMVEKFCYLGDMESTNGTFELAVTNRIRCSWSKFGQLALMLTAKDTSLTMQGKVYISAVRSNKVGQLGLHGSETYPIAKELERTLEQSEIRMVRWMCDKRLCDRVPSAELRDRLGIENISTILQRKRLRWFGHVQRKPDKDWTKRCMEWP